MNTTKKTGAFPLAARPSVTPWRYQRELENDAAYLIGHAARNVRAALNIEADIHLSELLRVRAAMARVFRKLKEETNGPK